MMLGKRSRSRPSFRRTSSMSGVTIIDVEAAAPPPPPTMIVDMLSPRYMRNNYSGVDTDFLRSCGLCNRRLAPGRDIYMYRGDTAFCSMECREQQMKQDERKERAAKTGETRHPEAETTVAAA